jgi:hypothetical protein
MDLGAGNNTDHAVAGNQLLFRVGVKFIPIFC